MALIGLTAPGVKRVTGASSSAWRRIVDGTTDTAALTLPSWTGTQPSGDNVLATEGYSALKLMFGGTDADDETMTFDVIAWYQFSGDAGKAVCFVPFRIAGGTVRLSALTYGTGASALGASANFIADTIEVGRAAPANGIYVFSPADDTYPAYIEIPTHGASLLEVRIDLGGAASADVFAQLGELTEHRETVHPVISHALINVGAGASTEIVAAPGTNKQIWVYGLIIMTDTAGTVTIEDGDGTDLSGVLPFGANGGAVLPMSPNLELPWVKVTTAKSLKLVTVTSPIDGLIVTGAVRVS